MPSSDTGAHGSTFACSFARRLGIRTWCGHGYYYLKWLACEQSPVRLSNSVVANWRVLVFLMFACAACVCCRCRRCCCVGLIVSLANGARRQPGLWWHGCLAMMLAGCACWQSVAVCVAILADATPAFCPDGWGDPQSSEEVVGGHSFLIGHQLPERMCSYPHSKLKTSTTTTCCD